jgi:hypothetical protein
MSKARVTMRAYAPVQCMGSAISRVSALTERKFTQFPPAEEAGSLASKPPTDTLLNALVRSFEG